MRVVLLDQNGSTYAPEMVPVGTMLPVANFITKTPAGEVVQVVQLDPSRQPQGIWNMQALG